MHGPYPLLPLTNCKMPTVQYQIQPHHVRETKKNEMEKWTQCELCFFARLMWSNSVNPNFDSKSLQTLLIVHVTGGIHKLFYKLIIQWSCLQDKVYQETNKLTTINWYYIDLYVTYEKNCYVLPYLLLMSKVQRYLIYSNWILFKSAIYCTEFPWVGFWCLIATTCFWIKRIKPKGRWRKNAMNRYFEIVLSSILMNDLS